MRPEEKQLHDQILQAAVERGSLLSAGFAAFHLTLIPRDASPKQVDDMRVAFMCGAQHLFASIMSILSPDAEPTIDDLRKMDLIAKELEAFMKEVGLRVAKTGRPQ